MVEDVTEHRRAEERLRTLTRAVEQRAESIVITDARARIEFVNEPCLGITGYAREELIGRNPRVLQTGRTPPATYDSLWATLQAGATWRGEFINRRKDGSEFRESAVISPVRQDDGAVTHCVAVKRVIGELAAGPPAGG